jgi:hypothetical protein
MGSSIRAGVLIVLAFLACTANFAEVSARAGTGSSGGHGGSGGHGFGGHGGGRGSTTGSGHSGVHSVGHALAHIFGGHAKSARVAPASPSSGGTKFVAVSETRSFRPRHHLIGFFPRRRFVFGGCPFLDSTRHRFANNCVGAGFFFDPFFFGAFDGAYLYDAQSDFWYGGSSSSTDPSNETAAPVNPTAELEGAERPITLLQLRDGSMYGLTEYWVEHNELHYVTTYGGEDSLPFERIDMESTVRLNVDRGVAFVLRPKSAVKR